MGLLLLRVAVGLSLAVPGGADLAAWDHGIGRWAADLLAILTGASLLIGFLTPVAAILAMLAGLSIALSWLPASIPDVFGGEPATIFMIVMAAAVFFLGPGAYSLDARLFGRREIIIPSAVD